MELSSISEYMPANLIDAAKEAVKINKNLKDGININGSKIVRLKGENSDFAGMQKHSLSMDELPIPDKDYKKMAPYVRKK